MSDPNNINMAGTVYEPRASTPAATLNPGDVFNQRYQVDRQLGAGGMGVAYLVDDNVTHEKVVLKLIHPSLIDEKARRRMIAEGINARKVRNPNVVAVYDVNDADGQTYLIMEYVAGEPLRHWMTANMASQRDAPLHDVVRVVQEILAGLAAAHRDGVIHRDLKPENIMIRGDPGAPDFALKILDFGIATGLKTEVFTSSMVTVGTPLYMAPEQLTAPNAVSAAADLYSVGRMFYEMLMDVLPDGTWNPPSENRPDVPAALDKVIQKCLQAPKFRYQSAAELSEAIDQAVSGTQAAETSLSVWRSQGGTELADSLKKLNNTLNQRLSGGVDRLTDLINTDRSVKPPDKLSDRAEKSDSNTGETQNKASKRTRWLVIAGLTVAVIIAAALYEDNGGLGPVNTMQRWRLDGGSVFTMQVSDGYVSGTGQLMPFGTVSVEGDINGQQLQVFAGGQYVADIVGGMTAGQGGMDYVGDVWSSGQIMQRILFHIDH